MVRQFQLMGDSDLEYKDFEPIILKNYFDLKVRELCKSCKRYGQKATCPPYIDSVDYYYKVLPTFNKGKLIIKHFIVEDCSKWKELGRTSSLEIMNKLKDMRKELMDQGQFSLIFAAGSCKYCSDVCTFPCKHPDQSAVPIEGTGINVVKLIFDIMDIKIIFPIDKSFYRVGMLLYD